MEGICEDDRPLMLEFYWLGYCSKELIALNTVCVFWNLIHVSDIIQCDGYSLDEFVVLDSSEELVLHTFPHKEPTVSNFRLWQQTICLLCGGTIHLPYQQGRFLSQPHLLREWFTDNLLGGSLQCLYLS
jgi:hypothetical protein